MGPDARICSEWLVWLAALWAQCTGQSLSLISGLLKMAHRLPILARCLLSQNMYCIWVLLDLNIGVGLPCVEGASHYFF